MKRSSGLKTNDESHPSSSSKSKVDGSGGRSKFTTTKKKNFRKMGGKGLSLEAFAKAKTRDNNGYNPALIKKKREFYKNAKVVNKYKKQAKELNAPPWPMELIKEENEYDANINEKNKKVKKESHKMEDIYARKREEKEKLRLEREATFKAKKEVRERAEARRKELREKMFKKTRKGQPVMKYRIEHLLETIQRSGD